MRAKPKTLLAAGVLVVLCAGRGEANAGTSVLKSEDNFKVTAALVPDATDLLSGKLVIELEALKGWKVSPEAPLLIEIKAPEALKLAKVKLRNADMVAPKAAKPRFDVSYTAPEKGRFDLKLKFDVVICTDKVCQKKRFESPFVVSAG